MLYELLGEIQLFRAENSLSNLKFEMQLAYLVDISLKQLKLEI